MMAEHGLAPMVKKLYDEQAGQKQKKKLMIIKICFRKTWWRPRQWKFSWPTQMAAMHTRSHFWIKLIGRPILRLMENILFFAAIMNTNVASHLTCILRILMETGWRK